MGISSRDYYRDWYRSANSGSWGIDGLTPAVKYLILANIVVFLLQVLVVRQVHLTPLEYLRKHDPELHRLLTQKEEGDPEAEERLKEEYPELDKISSEKGLGRWGGYSTERISIVQEWFELDTRKVVRQGQVWRLLTHAFCHDRYSILHIVFNMLCLYWFGCTLETMYGSREFVLFYLTAAVVAALAYVGLDLYTGSSTPAIGASGAVMAVMMLYTTHFPRQIIYIFWVFPVEMRWVMVFYVIWDLHPVLLTLSGEEYYTGIAHAAHLGGLAFGFLYAKYHWHLEGLLARVSWLRWKVSRRPRLRLAPGTLPDSRPAPDMDRVDQILQKIVETGQASLTDEEREVLRQASDRMKEERGDEPPVHR